MFRNQYDTDVGLWNPQGRLFQVEYAMEAVKLGTASVGLKNKDLAVLVALSKPTEFLSISLPKLFQIDAAMGMAICGITSDARGIALYLRTECNAHRHTYDMAYPVGRLATTLGNKLQKYTMGHSFRPVGVGILFLAGCDELGVHIYQVMPSANVFNCKAMAMGGRSQGSRTYLGRHHESFPDSSKDELICHGINAINAAHPVNDGLSVSIAIVGKNQPFRVLSSDECLQYQQMCQTESAPPAPAAGANDSDTDMQSNPITSYHDV